MEKNKQIVLIIVALVGIYLFLNAKPKDMGGEIVITQIPQEVKPSTIFNIQGYFVPSESGFYLLEAGPVQCPGECRGNVFDRAALITADKSACDGNVHYSGIFKEMTKGEKYTFSFNLKSSDIVGEYSYQSYVYNKCEKDGGVLLDHSETKKVTIVEGAREQEIMFGNKEGTINDFYEGTGNFLTSLGTTWKNMNEYTRFLVGALGIIFLVTLIIFKEPRKGK